jgi:hypothetical protein
MLQCAPAVALRLPAILQDFGTSRWQLASGAYINFGLPVRNRDLRFLLWT